MKILLINPFYTSNCSTGWYPPEPLGLLYLRESIRAIYGSKVTIKILDAQTEGGEEIKRIPSGYRNGMVDGEILNFLDSYKPDVVGITNNYTFGVKDAIEIAKLVKHFNNPVVILGGANATMDHERLIKLPWFDYVARGEGEDLFVEFIKRFLDGCFEKDTYKKYPKIMISHRAFVYGAREIANDLIMGCLSTEELKIMQGIDLSNKDIIDITEIQ